MSTTSSISSSSELQTQFLTLLVTQMKNQNPLDPMDSSEMTAQLAQFSELEQLENLSSQFSDVLTTTQESYASSLVGKTVTYSVTDDDGNTSYTSGTVSAMAVEDGEIGLVLDDDTTISIDDVLAVQ